MVVTASTEHPIGCNATQAIAFGWKPGFTPAVQRRLFERHHSARLFALFDPVILTFDLLT